MDWKATDPGLPLLLNLRKLVQVQVPGEGGGGTLEGLLYEGSGEEKGGEEMQNEPHQALAQAQAQAPAPAPDLMQPGCILSG